MHRGDWVNGGLRTPAIVSSTSKKGFSAGKKRVRGWSTTTSDKKMTTSHHTVEQCVESDAHAEDLQFRSRIPVLKIIRPCHLANFPAQCLGPRRVLLYPLSVSRVSGLQLYFRFLSEVSSSTLTGCHAELQEHSTRWYRRRYRIDARVSCKQPVWADTCSK